MQINYLARSLVAGILSFLLLLVSCTPAPTSPPVATPAPTDPPAPTAMPDPKKALVGTWTATVTKEDILRIMPDFHQEALCDNTGTFVWQFNTDGTFTVDQTALPECPTPDNAHIEDTWSIDGNLITLAKDTPFQEVYEWAVEGDSLVLKHVSGECIPCEATNTANPWTQVK
ncbi:MAG TPA: hypothetical protein VKE92_03580 [Anaerolineales bacterium]|jgi:hypothetical protein|nr:hypothetical protein [Anaerolineales bacterium]